jgi:hypothetical protein
MSTFRGTALPIAFALVIVGLGGTAVTMVRIAMLARRIHEVPTHIRVNPLNILAAREYWTDDIRRLHQLSVWFMMLFIGAVGTFLMIAML